MLKRLDLLHDAHHNQIDTLTALQSLYIIILQGSIGVLFVGFLLWTVYMEEARSISLVPLPVSEKGDLDMCSFSPLWPDSHEMETENKSQKGAASLMLAITGAGLQNTQ